MRKCQKRPIIRKKRPTIRQKRPILRQKRPTNTGIPEVCVSVKRDLSYGKRGLFIRQKRPVSIGIPEVHGLLVTVAHLQRVHEIEDVGGHCWRQVQRLVVQRHLLIYACMYVCIRVYMGTYICACMFTYIRPVDICMHVCVYTWVRT